MLDFTPITLADRETMSALLQKGHRGALEYNFTSNFIWRNIYHLHKAQMDGFLVVRAGEGADISYIFPSGDGDVKPIIDALITHHKQLGTPLLFNTVLNQDKETLESLYPGQFEFTSLRDAYDYVYLAESLRTLTGKKLAAKRNHINRFVENNPDWAYEPITLDNLAQVREMSREWCRIAGCRDNEELYDESCAVEQAFKNYEALGLEGGLIRMDGRIVAFAMGEPLNEETYVVHIEKAFYDIQGAYQIINREFARHRTENFVYINREDDTGDEGLRKAKLSYNPAFLVEKSSARWKG
jgi:hypothetical protein